MRVLILCLLLTGCCSTFCPCPPPVPPLVTKPKPPPADVFLRPKLSIEVLQKDSKANEVFEAYVWSTGELIDHVIYLERVLEGYR